MDIMKLRFSGLALIIIALGIGSCRPIEKLPAEPTIEYRSFKLFDTVDLLGNPGKGGRLNFYFEDGDGDLGLSQPQPGDTDTVNLFFQLFRKVNGTIEPAGPTDLLRPSNYRIPFMDRQGQNKILRGTIDVTFVYLFYSSSDTLLYEFYIKDRAGNESNHEMTLEIPLGYTGIIEKK